ncbi:hypothetical protein VNO77_34394 [Canavalia gladiata]|uniref:Uncharacterized protein n=1 Tax=Canavalia gladiata TaxID=3824 RepID=A0AAN9PYH7_CANGL
MISTVDSSRSISPCSEEPERFEVKGPNLSQHFGAWHSKAMSFSSVGVFIFCETPASRVRTCETHTSDFLCQDCGTREESKKVSTKMFTLKRVRPMHDTENRMPIRCSWLGCNRA